MYLDATRGQNPGLIATAVRLHQEGAIPPNSYVIDLSAVRHNAAVLAEEAKRAGVRVYLMTKHVNRNPLVAKAALAEGIDSTVAVDVQCALAFARFGLPVGHVGHLVQIPRSQLEFVLALRPEVMTVFSVEKAQQVAEAARRLGVTQDLLLRVRGEDDIIYPNEEGGVREERLAQAAREIGDLSGVRIAGVVTFPATLYSQRELRTLETPNFDTLRRSAQLLSGMGFEIEQVNAPGGSWSGGMGVVAAGGGTVAEPGHALTGTTPPVVDGIARERPGMVYLSEISHLFGDRAYAVGGGFYACDTPPIRGDDEPFRSSAWVPRALVGRDADVATSTPIEVEVASFFGRTNNATDYYGGTLVLDASNDVRVGDSAIYGFRPQAFTMRAFVTVVDDVDGEGRVVGIFDRANNLVDAVGRPYEDTNQRVSSLMGELVG